MQRKQPSAPRVRELDRRQFIKAGSLLGLGSMFLPQHLLAQPMGEAGGCAPTSDDILGPYYLPGAPVTTLVAAPGEPGERLFIAGTMLANDCTSPIPDTRIEVWQANDAAVYDTSPAFNLRATFHSDANGQYAFETIMPGPYLNGNQYRPKHIHFRVNRPGYPELITQLYFEGDPYIAADPWASQPDAAHRIIPLNPVGEGASEGVFDIVLDGSVGIKPNRFGTEGDLLPVFPNPMQERCNIHFNVFRPARVTIHIADVNGRVLTTLLDQEHTQGRYTTAWNGQDQSGSLLPSGTYLCLLQIDQRPVKAQRIMRVVG